MKPIAITLGDAAGIGPEIIAKAFIQSPDVTQGCLVVGDLGILRRALQVLARDGGPALPVALMDTPNQLGGVPPGCVPLIQVGPPVEPPAWSQVSAVAGRLAADCVVWAARAALRGDIAGVVTAPLHKEALAAAGVVFPGHTELLQAEAAAYLGKRVNEVPVRMMLANDELRTVLVSIHMSLRDAIDAVTFESVLQTLHITHDAVGRAIGRSPRIGLAGLNPHAGEGGIFGREELEVLIPAVQAARAAGMNVVGPLAPDTAFMRARHTTDHPGEFDVVVAMYHDQGLIPIKYLGVDKGVNVTLGLPLVRTSPDHGTAFDIAGQGIANPASLIAAIRMAKGLSGTIS